MSEGFPLANLSPIFDWNRFFAQGATNLTSSAVNNVTDLTKVAKDLTVSVTQQVTNALETDEQRRERVKQEKLRELTLIYERLERKRKREEGEEGEGGGEREERQSKRTREKEREEERERERERRREEEERERERERKRRREEEEKQKREREREKELKVVITPTPYKYVNNKTNFSLPTLSLFFKCNTNADIKEYPLSLSGAPSFDLCNTANLNKKALMVKAKLLSAKGLVSVQTEGWDPKYECKVAKQRVSDEMPTMPTMRTLAGVAKKLRAAAMTKVGGSVSPRESENVDYKQMGVAAESRIGDAGEGMQDLANVAGKGLIWAAKNPSGSSYSLRSVSMPSFSMPSSMSSSSMPSSMPSSSVWFPTAKAWIAGSSPGR